MKRNLILRSIFLYVLGAASAQIYAIPEALKDTQIGFTLSWDALKGSWGANPYIVAPATAIGAAISSKMGQAVGSQSKNILSDIGTVIASTAAGTAVAVTTEVAANMVPQLYKNRYTLTLKSFLKIGKEQLSAQLEQPEKIVSQAFACGARSLIGLSLATKPELQEAKENIETVKTVPIAEIPHESCKLRPLNTEDPTTSKMIDEQIIPLEEIIAKTVKRQQNRWKTEASMLDTDKLPTLSHYTTIPERYAEARKVAEEARKVAEEAVRNLDLLEGSARQQIERQQVAALQTMLKKHKSEVYWIKIDDWKKINILSPEEFKAALTRDNDDKDLDLRDIFVKPR